MSCFSQKTGDPWLGSASCVSKFFWIWLILKLSTGGYFRAHTLKSTIHHLARCHRRVPKHRDRFWSIFFDQLPNCVGSNGNKFFWQSNVHAILNVWWSHKCLRLSQSHDRSHDDPATSVGTQLQWFTEQQLILDGFHEIRLGVNYDLDWIHHTSDKHWSLMEPHL